MVRARELLGQALRRRGVGVSAGILASALARPGEGAVSARLTIGTVRVAALLSGGKTMAPGMVSERALGLAQEAAKAVSSANLKTAALLLAIAAVAVSAGWVGVHVLSRREDPVQPSSAYYGSSA